MLYHNLATLSKNQTTIYIPLLLKSAIIHKPPVHTIQINSIDTQKIENKLSTHITQSTNHSAYLLQQLSVPTKNLVRSNSSQSKLGLNVHITTPFLPFQRLICSR